MRRLLLLLLATSAVSCTSNQAPVHSAITTAKSSDIKTVDEYLDAMSLLVDVPSVEDVKKMSANLERRRPEFEASLARLLKAGDPRAPGRLVYSQVILVGDFLNVESPVGKAAMPLLGKDVRVQKMDGDQLIFAGDLYLWWRSKAKQYEPYPALTRWENSDLAKKSVIPMYEKQAATVAARPSTSEP
jgi:hypothetical protein